jgi:GcrA cell cycle regulator
MTFAWDETNAALAVERWRAGDSAAQIGKRLGCTRNSVLGKVHRLGMATRAKPSAPAVRKPKPTVQWKAKATPPRPPRAYPVILPEGPGTATILTLEAFMCKWPMSGDGEAITFCGAGRAGSGPYCARHTLISHQPPAPRRSRSAAAELARSLRRYL